MAEDLIVRFAGEGGQGVVTASEGLSQAAAQVGYHVQTFSTFPSQIKGGPTLGQTRVSTLPILSSGDGSTLKTTKSTSLEASCWYSDFFSE